MVINPNGQRKFTMASFLPFITSHSGIYCCSFRLITIIDYHQFELYLTNLTYLLNDLTYH